MNLMIVPGMLVCSSFLISVCMFNVSKALLIFLLGFGMGTMLANLHMCGIMLVLRAVFNMLVRNASPRGPMCF